MPNDRPLAWGSDDLLPLLEQFNEKPLWENFHETDTYRFIWLRSFHDPVVIRLWQSGKSRWRITTKRLGKEKLHEWSRFVPSSDARRVQQLFDSPDFWESPATAEFYTEPGTIPFCVDGIDGPLVEKDQFAF